MRIFDHLLKVTAMIELVIVACLMTGDCKEVRLTYDAQVFS
jgi:hypothetical protein